MTGKIEDRKRAHLDLCATDDVNFKQKTTLFEQVELIHRAVPGLDFNEIDTKTTFAGVDLAAPLWISSMTGGAEGAGDLNRQLARIAGDLEIGFCLGSLRPMLEDPKRKSDFNVRKSAGSTLVLGNIGATEIVKRGPRPILDAVEDIGTNGLIVHLNTLMELIQPGGDTNFKGVIDGIIAMVEESGDVAIVVKETGCGLSWQDGEALRDAGVKSVEVAGAGGTSWIGVETLRADGREERFGRTLWDWGIPTAVSTAWMVDLGFDTVASGGIRTGLDMARALALGAGLTGVAAPVIRTGVTGGEDAVREYLNDLVFTLRGVMLACGAKDCGALSCVPRVMGDDLARWIETGWQSR